MFQFCVQHKMMTGVKKQSSQLIVLPTNTI